MCGIVGLFDITGKRQFNRSLLNDMNNSQTHRGPDESGLHLEAGVALGHRRLSIIDLSSGQQPLFNHDQSIVVTYNGEIYNFKSLRKILQKEGHQFKTHCDTEVIVYAWAQWGEKCVDHFRGMFAFALWDRNKQQFFLARDRLGIKPLYYSLLNDGQFIFSSELKALKVHPDLPKEIDPQALEDYFAYGYVPEPKTIYQQVYKLKPGFSLLLTPQSKTLPEPQQYWDIPFKAHEKMDEREAGEELLRQLKEAVDIRMEAEVPLGAFLSGGVDSSAVVAAMAGLSDDPVKTCSISFGDPKFNETQYAQQIADQFKTNHHVEQVDPEDFSLIDKLTELYDEPYADSSALPTYRVCELAKKDVTVVLSGDGGDENLAGYRRYRWHLIEEQTRAFLPSAIRRPLFGTLGTVYPKLDWMPKVFRAKSTFESLARNPIEGWLHTVSHYSDKQRQQLFSSQMHSDLQGYNAVNVLQGYADQAPTDHPQSLVQYLDLKTYLVGDILTKVDRASMAHALEVRVPLLDHKLVEWMSGLPPELKLKNAEGKYIFKKALETQLPKDILYRKKMGFSVPLANWFRGPLKQKVIDSLLSDDLLDNGYFNPAFIQKLVKQHFSGQRDNSATIWSLLMYASFQRQN